MSVIVCHHTGNLISGFIDSIFESTNVNFEVIVMTSNSELATKGIRDCRVFYHEGLPATKRNAGARLSKGRYLAFFDDDVTVSPDCLWKLKLSLIPTVGMVYGKLWNMEFRNRFDEAGSFLTATGFLWSRAGQNDIDEGQFDKTEFVLAGKSASCMVKANIFKLAGGFDEDFGILGEETDLSWRVWLSGFSVVFQPEATGYHAFNTKFKPKEKHYTSERVHFNGCRNYITMLIKNLEWRNLWTKLIAQFTIWFSAGFVMIITGRVQQGWNIWRGLGYILANWKYLTNKRERIQNNRVKSDRDLLPIIQRRPPRGYYTQRFTRYITQAIHG